MDITQTSSDRMLKKGNETTQPAVSRLTKCTCPKIGVAILVAICVALAFYAAFKPSGDGNSDEQASTHGTAKQTGSVQELVDPDRHLLQYSAEGELCKESIVPYKAKASDKSDYSGLKYIQNSTCLLCYGKCKTLDEIKERDLCNNDVILKKCYLKRDMKNMDKGACGGAGKYVCFLEENEPECNCTNNMKVGELCQHETKVPCKCWTSKLRIPDQENIPNCLDPKQIDEWTTCLHDFDHDFKCLCNNTEISGTLRDCTQARTETQKATNCGSNVHVSMVVWGVIMLLHGYKYNLIEV